MPSELYDSLNFNENTGGSFEGLSFISCLFRFDGTVVANPHFADILYISTSSFH